MLLLSFLQDWFATEMDLVDQPVVTIFQSLEVVHIMAGVIVKHLLRIAGGADVVLHGGLVEVLFVICELEQQGNGCGVPDEIDRVDLADHLTVFFELAGRLAFPKIGEARIAGSQIDVTKLGYSGH